MGNAWAAQGTRIYATRFVPESDGAFLQGAFPAFMTFGEFDKWVLLGELTDVSGPGLTSDAAETTDHSAEGWREFIQGLKNSGEVSIRGNFQSDADLPLSHEQELIQDKFVSGEIYDFVIAFAADAGVWGFRAFVLEAQQPEAPADDIIMFAAELKATGDIDFSAIEPTLN